MNDGEFTDTNIAVYAHDGSAGPKRAVARNLIARLWRDGHGVLSVQVLSEFYTTCIRKGIPAEEVRRRVGRFSGWQVHSPTERDVLAAIELSQRFQLSFWDAMIVRSAQATGARILWTEDLQDGQRFGDVVVRNPFAGVATR